MGETTSGSVAAYPVLYDVGFSFYSIIWAVFGHLLLTGGARSVIIISRKHSKEGDSDMTKCLWITDKEATEYEAERHVPKLRQPEELPYYEMAWKFLYWRDGGDGNPLLIVCGRRLETHKDLLEVARAVMDKPPPDAPADGAGDIDRSGFILSWYSSEFRVDTPSDLIPDIAGLLGVNK